MHHSLRTIKPLAACPLLCTAPVRLDAQPKMAEEVTYADLKFMTLKQAKEQEEKQKAGGKASPPVFHHWRLATVTLGIFCLALLGVSGALGFKGRRCSPCPERWLQRGENCYYFSSRWNSWEESRAQCATLDARLLKIESKEELAFMLESAQAYNAFWIGLFRSTARGPWLWEDNSTFSSDLFKIPEDGSSHYPICVSIQGGNLIASDCLGYRFCICEKVATPA
ncbi:UNVERIFIED_CONTAM: hypothetical protein K2H54_013446 [Gekko kuhli]